MSIALALHHDTPSRKSVPLSCCPRCGCSLTLHQPDPELADRLLATCDDCKSWYLTNPSGAVLSPVRQRKDQHRRH